MNHPNPSVFQRSEPPRSEVESHSGSPWSEADAQALSPASIAPIDEYARRAAAAPALNCRRINRLTRKGIPEAQR